MEQNDPIFSLSLPSAPSSMGAKLLLLSFLALVMGIPALFVWGLVSDRSNRAVEVKNEVAQHAGGAQTFLGPTLLIPYAPLPGTAAISGIYAIFPADATGAIKLRTEERRRSLFRVPVYNAELKLDANFDLSHAPEALPENTALDWSRAQVVIGVSDPHAALSDATLNVGGKSLVLTPATVPDSLFGHDASTLAFIGARAGDIAKPGAVFRASSDLKFSGADRIAALPYGKTTRITVSGDWANPGFDGAFLPTTHNSSSNNFSAQWYVPFIARGVKAEGPATSFATLTNSAMAVALVEVADPYQSVVRALKYALLFNALVFLSYFVFEVSTGKRLHPAQYLLVGVAQIVFYLLLLSLAEHTGFDAAFLLAGLATVCLLAINARWVFESSKNGWQAFGIFAVLYSLIYSLLRLEDNALLIGSVASFAAIAAAMYATRKIDWYACRTPVRQAPSPPEIAQ